VTEPTLIFILHAHLPYVRPTGAEILEERWLYEAVTETYVPLLWALERLAAYGIRPRLTLSLSAPLLSMLGDPELMARCRGHVARMGDLAVREAERLSGTELEPAARFHRERFASVLAELDRRGDDLLTPFGELAQAGTIELITAAGTHPILPLLASDRMRQLHLDLALQEFEGRFGYRPKGLWLPESAYHPGLDHLLAAAGIDWSFVETGAVRAAYPPVGGPVLRTPGGVALFGRDPFATRQVWDAQGGYPGHPNYREFYRDQGYDLPLERLRPYLVEGRVRSDTGLKFYRVTGEGPGVHGKKAPYQPAWAIAQVKEHARHFVESLRGRPGPIVAPFDAELFGHWWFEGPAWIEEVFRLIGTEGGVRSASPSDWLAEGWAPPPAQVPASTWGSEGDFSVWVGPANDRLWPQLHAAESRFLDAVSLHGGPLTGPELETAGRALLLAQASDLPFILSGGTATQWAEREFRHHLGRFWATLTDSAPEPDSQFLPHASVERALSATAQASWSGPLRILMLTWEFPPQNVGGLGRHVYDLGKAIVAQGHQVCVLTPCAEGETPGESAVAGMQVRRIARPPEERSFLRWTYRLNWALREAAVTWAAETGPFALVHAHDWLVGQAAMALQAIWRVPFIATIHAMEQGRNGSIQNDLQAAIHEEEIRLCQTADRVITVSEAMGKAVAWYSHVRPTVIYNGVDLPGGAPARVSAGGPAQAAAAAVDDRYFFFIGRLVPEKGVQTAIEAMVHLPSDVRLLIAGKGPMEEELKALTARLDLGERVRFVGRIADIAKEALLAGAVGGLVPSLYEPFGIVALEVMASGVPVIVGETGGLMEIVTHERNGLRAYPGDALSLAAQMIRLLTDQELRGRLVAAANRDLRLRFNWVRIAEQTLAVYDEGFRHTFTKSL
jgi:1,4-alpha-glucan branching enzyme